MPDPLMGRYAAIKISTTLVENLGKWTLDLSGSEIDVSAFGDVWEKKMPGMQGWTASIEGMYDPADTDGQAILIAAKLAATKIQNIRFYVDSTSYWTPNLTSNTLAGCYIQNVSINHDKAGVAQITMNVLGYGAIVLV
jgi:hypothetical protein